MIWGFLLLLLMVSSHCTTPRTGTVPRTRRIIMGFTIICRTLHTAPRTIMITIYVVMQMGFKPIFLSDFCNDKMQKPVATQLLLFLGGLRLYLNHLIQSRMEISYWLFGTLPIGLLLSNLDSRQLETSPMTSYD